MTAALPKRATPAPSGSESADRPGAGRVWWLAIRPRTLPASAAPVLVGAALAAGDGVFSWGPALAALVGALLIQVGTNLANDLFDFRKGADTADRLGPARATQKGWLTERQVAAGTAASLGLAFAVGLYLAWVGGWPIVAIGLASLVCAVGYTGGPFPLAYNGLGDVFVLGFFGPVAVGGTYWVQANAWPIDVLVASLPIGLLATAILVVNNLRDRHTDARVGKRTLAVRFGARAARAEYAALVALAYAVFPALWLSGLAESAWVLLPLASLPLAVARTRAVLRTDGAALNPLLGATAQLGLLVAVLQSLVEVLA